MESSLSAPAEPNMIWRICGTMRQRSGSAVASLLSATPVPTAPIIQRLELEAIRGGSSGSRGTVT